MPHDPYAICPLCDTFIDDGEGTGFVRRHNETEAHVAAVRRGQQKAKDMARDKNDPNYVPWEIIEVGEEEHERLKLRRALEALQREEETSPREWGGNDDGIQETA